MSRRKHVRSFLVAVAIVVGLFTPMLMEDETGAVAAESLQLKKIYLNTTVSTDTHLEQALRTLDELEVSVEVRGFDKTNLVPYAPKGSLRVIDRYVVALDSPHTDGTSVSSSDGRFMVTFRFRVLQPDSASLVLRSSSGSEFAVSNPFGSAVLPQELEPLTLDAITPPTPRTGTRKPVVLLVDFSDRQPNAISTPSFYQSLLFDSTVPRSTMQDYFYDVSYGQLNVAGSTYGSGGTTWIRLPQTFAYYNEYTDSDSAPHFGEFISDVITYADPVVNFANHDGNGDGYVDGIVIIYAGRVDAPWAKGLWPCSGPLSYTLDGKQTDRFTIQSEYGSTPGDTGISIFCHEYAHAMGARDFYDYDGVGVGDGPSAGAGRWTLMAWDDRQLMDPFHRYYMGWVTPTTIETTGTYTVAPAEGSANVGTVFRVNLHLLDEYLLIENRQQTGWDSVLPGSGLVIWHIDEGVTTSNNSQWYPGHTSGGHYFAAVEQADGLWELERGVNGGNAGDIYQPGSSLTPLTTPTSLSYDGSGPLFAIDEIALAGSSISFHLSPAASSAVVLTDPADGSVTPTLTPTLSWQPYAGATAYRVRVASDAAMSTLVVDTNVGSSTSFAVPSDTLGLSTSCFWLVSALASDVVIAKSPIWSFTTCGDAFEPDGDPASAKGIATDGSLQRHNFAASGDVDWVKFTAVAGTTYTIDTLIAEANAYPAIDLYAPDGTSILDRSYSWESRIDFECPAGKGGTYYVRVWQEYGSYGANTGYDLRIQPALQVTFSNADNAGKDYGFTNILNDVTVTVTRGGAPVAGASVNVDWGASTLTTDASGQATFTVQKSWDNYTYVQVASGASKVTGAYFWVIDPASGLITVKPRDVAGYYLTRFSMDAWDLVGGSAWTNWGSGTSNTFTVPTTVSSSNLAIVTASGDQRAWGGYVFTLNPTLTAGQKTVLTPNAATDCVALGVSATLDSVSLTNAQVYLRNQAHASTTSSYAARIDSSGASLAWVTPGTYTAVVRKNNSSSPSVWLMKKNIVVSSSTMASIAFTTSQLGTLTCTALDGSNNPANYNYLGLLSEGISTELYTTSSNSTLLFSPGMYQESYDYVYLYPSGTSERWGYGFDTNTTRTVTAGSAASVTFGGPLAMTVNTPSPVISGQSVTTKLTVADPQGHRLYHVYGYTDSFSPAILPGEFMKGVDPRALQEERSAFTPDDGIDARPPAGADAWGYVYPNPRLIITDPAAVVKVDRQDRSLSSAYYGYGWTVATDAAPGTWNAGFTFDTGVYQGVIATEQTFTVVLYPPDAFEPDGDQASAKGIATDGSLQRHNFAASGDVDWVKFTAVAGTTYTIDTLIAEANAYPAIDLYAPDGTSIFDRSYSWESRIDFECPAGKGGTYYVRVWQEYGSYGANTGYDLRIQPALQVTFSNADNAGKDYGFTNILNDVTVTVTRGGAPVAGASVNVDWGASTLTTNASGQATFTCQRSWLDYSYLQVTSGTSKVTSAYFWVIEPTYGLMSVKPLDINGYYLTRFTLDAFDLVGGWWWRGNGSGTSNTFTMPAPVSSSNLAVVTAPSDQHGGGGYVFTLNPTLTAGQQTVLTPNAATDCVALSLNAALDGSPLTSAYVYLRNQAYASTTSSRAALTSSSGDAVIYVTPGTYTAVAKKSNYSTPSVWLTKKGIAISSSTTSSIAFTTSQLGTLTCTATDGSNNPAQNNYLYLQSEGISTSLRTTPLNSTLRFSPGTYREYLDYMYLYPSGTSEQWYYQFNTSTTRTVTAGSAASVTFGGPLVMTVNTPSPVIPGQSVTTKLTIADPQGHHLYYVDGYTDSFSPAILPGEFMKGVDPRALQEERSAFTPDDGMNVGPPVVADAWGWVSPNPRLIITDPAATVKLDRQNVSLDSAYWDGYAWTVPADAVLGTWHAAFTFDTGVYQGVIATEQTFILPDPNALVTHYYSSLLARSPDEPGRLFWLSEITRIQSLGIDVREGFIALARLFLTSPEYLAKGTTDPAYITTLYNAFFNRIPPTSDVTYWTGLMAAGMSRDITMNWFVYSPEYAAYMTGILGSTPTRPENNLVNDLYRGFLNRLPDSAGFAHQLTAMRAAQASGAAAVRTATRTIALAFLGSAEYALRARTNAQFIEDCYNGILRRGALAAEILHWVNYLAAGHTRIEVLNYFVDSPEFQTRVDELIAAGPFVP